MSSIFRQFPSYCSVKYSRCAFRGHSFSKWIHFGGEGKIAEQTPEEMEKHIKYKDLLANCLVLHNTVEISNVLNGMAQEGFVLTKEDLAALSPYQTNPTREALWKL